MAQDQKTAPRENPAHREAVYSITADVLDYLEDAAKYDTEHYFQIWPSGLISCELNNFDISPLVRFIIKRVIAAMSDKTAKSVIEAVEETLRTAEFGLEDMRTRPGRARSGLRNAVVFGRMVTFALQNLSSVVPAFDAWYSAKQAEMKVDPLMRYFVELRNAIEKQAKMPTSTSVHIKSFSPVDMEKFKPAPPGAIGFFIGDQMGGSGWEVKRPDGAIERYYVDIPEENVTIFLCLPDAPPEIATGRTADQLVEEYLTRLKALAKEAKERFELVTLRPKFQASPIGSGLSYVNFTCRCQYPLKSTEGLRVIASATIRFICSPFETRRLSSRQEDS